MDVLLLTEAEVGSLLSMPDVIGAVESALREYAQGSAQMPAKTYLEFPKFEGDLRTMPAYLEKQNLSAVKIVTVNLENAAKFHLPTVRATIFLVDPQNGSVLSIMGGANITAMRTGAAGGIAAKYLARKDSRVAGFIGAGVQARTQLAALLSVLPQIEEVRVWDLVPAASEKFVQDTKPEVGKRKVMKESERADAVRDVDVLVTTTPSREPVVLNKWVSEGTHINAIGADAPGKEELDPEILKRSKIVVDNWEQASHSGEVNVPITKGILTRKDIWAELGDVIIGKRPGRTSDKEVTIFDSTGLAVQDVASANLVYKKALSQKVGHTVQM